MKKKLSINLHIKKEINIEKQKMYIDRVHQTRSCSSIDQLMHAWSEMLVIGLCVQKCRSSSLQQLNNISCVALHTSKEPEIMQRGIENEETLHLIPCCISSVLCRCTRTSYLCQSPAKNKNKLINYRNEL